MDSQIGRDAAFTTEEDAAVQQVLQSGTFRKAAALRRVLAYLWENHSLAPTEYSIAIDALERRPDFDPRVDATVRVHIARLRQKLKEYYETEGAGASIAVSIPAGAYHLEFQRAEEKPPAEVATPPPELQSPWRMLAVAAVAVALVSTALAIYYSRQAARPASLADLPRFWTAFLSNGKPVKLVIPTPVFFSWPAQNLRVRDILVDDFEAYRQSPGLRHLEKEMGPPELSLSYNVVSDTLGAVRLIQFFAPKGRYLEVTGVDEFSIELFGNHNLIFLGIPHTSPHLRRFLGLTNFATEGNFTILNRHPLPTEPRAWNTTRISDHRQIRPGLIALLPGQAAGTRLLLVSGGHAASLVSFLISPSSLRTLDEIWTKNGSPEHFEFVVLAEVESNSVVKAQAVAFRSVSASLWK